jgi:hypothetical protein
LGGIRKWKDNIDMDLGEVECELDWCDIWGIRGGKDLVCGFML